MTVEQCSSLWCCCCIIQHAGGVKKCSRWGNRLGLAVILCLGSSFSWRRAQGGGLAWRSWSKTNNTRFNRRRPLLYGELPRRAALVVQVLDTTAGPNRLVLERPGGPSDNHSEEIAGG